MISPAFEVVHRWEQAPRGWTERSVLGVAVDSRDRVYLLTRDARLTLYNPDGSYAGTWGDSILAGKTHCVRFAPDGSVFTVDDGDHTVRKFSPDGQLLLTLGVPGVPADTGYDQRYRGRDTFAACSSIERAGPPFNRPTSLAIAPSGELYVSDGYANARVHRFAESGAWLASWGVPGTAYCRS